MKKIVLGCAAVLLSLGLLAGCNNKEDEPPIEEAVVITVDSAASVVVGESLSLTYTVSPAKAEVVAASDNESIVTAVAQEGTLYLEGVAEGSAIVTLVGTYEGYASANKNINVSVITKEEEDTEPGVPGTGGEGGEDEPAVKLTIENTLSLTLPEVAETAEPVKIEYTVEPTEEEGTEVNMTSDEDESIIKLQNLNDGWYVTPLAAGSATISVTAEYTSDEGVEYTPDSAELKVIVSEYTAPEPEPVFESYTVELTLKTSGGQAFPDPEETYSVWIQSDYDGTSNSAWGSEHQMTYSNGVYTYTYEGEPGWTSDSYSAGIHAGYEGAVVWGDAHQFGTITIPNPTSESGAVTGQFEVTSYIGDDWETIFDFGSDVNFYLLLVDTSNTAAASVSDQGYWHTSDNATYFDGANWCASTIATTGTTGVSCLYNATVGVAPSGTSDWFSITTDDSGWSDEIGYGTVEIPEPTNADDCEICVANVDLSKLGATTTSKQQNVSYTWVEYSGITEYIATL